MPSIRLEPTGKGLEAASTGKPAPRMTSWICHDCRHALLVKKGPTKGLADTYCKIAGGAQMEDVTACSEFKKAP